MAELGHVVVVGGSLAGLRACESLRTKGFEGGITLVGAETHLPYDRPPLSKQVLSGDWTVEQIQLRKPEQLADLRLELRLGSPAVQLDTEAQRVHLADSASVPYDGLIIATGASVRRLPNQPDVPGVFDLRTLDDSLALRDALADGSPRVVVIGAGFIGLEVAATARKRGLEVTVLEGAPAPLIRGLGAEMGELVARSLHEPQGVAIRCGVGVAAIEHDGRVTGVRLAGGALVPADIVVVGIGVVPNTGWLEGSGLEIRDGVVADETLKTGAPNVYVAGDCARWTNPLFEEEARIEHWTIAAEQGASAAANLLAVSRGEDPTPYAPVPFFWSMQYDARIQFLGRAGADDVQVVHGDPATGSFVALYGRAGRLRGVLGISLPKRVMPFKKQLEQRVSWDDALAFAAAQS